MTKPEPKKKEPKVCRHCAVELSWKELNQRICFACMRNRDDKEREYQRQHNGLWRQ